MSTIWHDLRFSLRSLARRPGFSAVAVLTLALGIGANTTIFSWINSTLFTPIPGVKDTGSLVSLTKGERSDSPFPPCSYDDYRDLREKNHSFSGLLAYHDDWMALTGTGKPERIYGAVTSANYFDVLGVRPILGRGFLPEEEGKPNDAPVVVIGYDLWQSHFAGKSTIIGTIIEVNRYPYTIIGVAPPFFQGCKTGLRADLWIPLAMDPVITGWHRLFERDTAWLNLMGRLRPGIDLHQAQADMNLIMGQLTEQFPDAHRSNNAITLDHLWRSPFGANSYLHSLLPMLLAIAGVVLLLACANVANLLLVHGVGRRREIAIRLSLGARRWRLVRQLLVESLVLAITGGAVALCVTAAWSAGTFGKFLPATSIPISLPITVDRAVFLTTFLISLTCGLIFGILPALRSSSLVPTTVLKEEASSVSGGLHKSHLASSLVVAQIALSLLLLICAGLFTRSFHNAQQADPGFDPDHVLLTSFELRAAGILEHDGLVFDKQLLAKLETIPGVESITMGDWVPLDFPTHATTIDPEGYIPQPHESLEVMRANVGPHFFRTLKIPLISGRDFTLDDNERSEPVAIVNQTFVDRYWPGQNPLGKRINNNGRWFVVVGLAKNSKYNRINEAPRPFLFQPLLQNYFQEVTLFTRVTGAPEPFASTIEKVIHQLNKDVPVFDVTSLKSRVQVTNVFVRISGTFVGAFGLLALVLAAIGIYGVVAYTTRQRTHEIGIRVALGATKHDIYRLVFLQGIRLAQIGLVIGLGMAFLLTRFLESQLVGITAMDPMTYGVVTIGMSVVVLAACYFPARRAAEIDPNLSLRYQ